MSKHTNKVHGKLNFLIVAVVLVIGAVAFLLIQSETFDFNPSDLTSSGNKAIKGVKKAEKYDNRKDVVVTLEGEEIQDFLNNQDFTKMIADPVFAKIASDPATLQMLASPELAQFAAMPGGLEFLSSPALVEFAAMPGGFDMLAQPNALQMLALPEFQKMMSGAEF